MNVYNLLSDTSIPYMIFRIAEAQYLDANRQLKAFNLTLEQTVLMYHIMRNENISQKELSDKVIKDQANTTRILKRLTAKGLVTVDSSTVDKRVNLVNLTEQGIELLNNITPFIDNATKRFIDLFTKDELENLQTMLVNYYKVYESHCKNNNWEEQ